MLLIKISFISNMAEENKYSISIILLSIVVVILIILISNQGGKIKDLEKDVEDSNEFFIKIDSEVTARVNELIKETNSMKDKIEELEEEVYYRFLRIQKQRLGMLKEELNLTNLKLPDCFKNITYKIELNDVKSDGAVFLIKDGKHDRGQIHASSNNKIECFFRKGLSISIPPIECEEICTIDKKENR